MAAPRRAAARASAVRERARAGDRQCRSEHGGRERAQGGTDAQGGAEASAGGSIGSVAQAARPAAAQAPRRRATREARAPRPAMRQQRRSSSSCSIGKPGSAGRHGLAFLDLLPALLLIRRARRRSTRGEAHSTRQRADIVDADRRWRRNTRRNRNGRAGAAILLGVGVRGARENHRESGRQRDGLAVLTSVRHRYSYALRVRAAALRVLLDHLSARTRSIPFCRQSRKSWVGTGLLGTQVGQHWPACISACVSPVHGAHTCLHWQAAQHAPSGITGSLPSAQTILGQSILSQTSDSPPAPAARAGAPAAPAPGAPAPGAPAPGAPAPGAPATGATTRVLPACAAPGAPGTGTRRAARSAGPRAASRPL